MEGTFRKKINHIVRIWFEGDHLYGECDDGKIVRQSLLWYPNLMKASERERANYRMGLTGIHWRDLDEDISFESFFYDDCEPSSLQRFFMTHPEINVTAFAHSLGLNASLLRNYINGFKKPSKKREDEILSGLHKLGEQLKNLSFS